MPPGKRYTMDASKEYLDLAKALEKEEAEREAIKGTLSRLNPLCRPA